MAKISAKQVWDDIHTLNVLVMMQTDPFHDTYVQLEFSHAQYLALLNFLEQFQKPTPDGGFIVMCTEDKPVDLGYRQASFDDCLDKCTDKV